MLSLHRASFRQLLLVAFLLIAALLASTSLHGLFTLERLIVQSRKGAERAVQSTAAVQTLAERSVAMERAARQYLVLDDPSLRERFDAAMHFATSPRSTATSRSRRDARRRRATSPCAARSKKGGCSWRARCWPRACSRC